MSILSALLNEDILGRPSSDPLLEVQATPVSKREVYISIRRDGVVGDGTRENPYDGSSRDNLDVILNGNLDPTLRSPVRFIFGPGIFRTDGGWKASTEESGLWTGIWPGQEFVGAGMFATTLRLELAKPLENASSAA